MVSREHAGAGFGQLLGSGELRKHGDNGFCHRSSCPFFAIVYLIDGQGWFSSRPTGGRQVRAGDALILHPDVPHTYGPRPGEVWHEVYFTFTGPVFTALFDAGILAPERAVVRLALAERWAWRLREFLGQAVAETPRQRLSTVARVLSLLIEIDATQQLVEMRPFWMDAALDELASTLTLQIDLPAVAARCGLSYDQFRKQFRAATGESPGQYHTTRIMRRACEMLYSGRYTVKEVAHHLGFCDAFHFSKRFKACTWQVPSQFIPRNGR